MPRSDRLLRLMHAIRTFPPPVTVAVLARETGVSERTLYRDIEALRAAGALIDGAPGYGYCLTEDPALPPQTFSRLEIEALVLGLGQVRASGDAALADAAHAALAKIVATLPDRLQRQALHAVLGVHRFHVPPDLAVDTAPIREACWAETALDLLYRSREPPVRGRSRGSGGEPPAPRGRGVRRDARAPEAVVADRDRARLRRRDDAQRFFLRALRAALRPLLRFFRRARCCSGVSGGPAFPGTSPKSPNG